MASPWQARDPLPRPSWWTPDQVLERLRNGERAGNLCQIASAEMGGGISPRTLRRDINLWRESLSYGEQFTAALAIWKRGAVERISTDWYEDFYEALREAEGKIALACDSSGIGPDLVYALRDKRNSCYDKIFDEEVRKLEGLRFSKIRENFLEQAEVGTAEGAKLAAKALESSMPGLHAPKQQLEVSGRIEHDHEHTHLLPPEVVAASQERTRALLAGRQRALPPPDRRSVIDVTPVKEKAVVSSADCA